MAGGRQRAEEGPVVDLVVARHLDAAAYGRAECRHQAPALARAAPLRVQPERVLVGEEVVEAGAIGRIERDGHRPGGVVADDLPAGVLQCGGKGGPEAGALEEERGER